MGKTISHPKDFWSGLLFLAIGAGAVFIGQDYEIGSARRMGPGFFPVVLGGLLALIGAAALARGFIRKGEPVGHLQWKALALVLGGVILFGVLLRGAGLVAAIVVLVLVAARASPRAGWTWKALAAELLLAAGLALLCVILFVKLLGLPLPVIGPWLDW